MFLWIDALTSFAVLDYSALCAPAIRSKILRIFSLISELEMLRLSGFALTLPKIRLLDLSVLHSISKFFEFLHSIARLHMGRSLRSAPPKSASWISLSLSSAARLASPVLASSFALRTSSFQSRRPSGNPRLGFWRSVSVLHSISKFFEFLHSIARLHMGRSLRSAPPKSATFLGFHFHFL